MSKGAPFYKCGDGQSLNIRIKYVWKVITQKLCNILLMLLLSFPWRKHCVEHEMSILLMIHNLKISWFLHVYNMAFLLWVRIIRSIPQQILHFTILTHKRKTIRYTHRNQLILRLCSTRIQDISHSTQCFPRSNESKNNHILLHNFWDLAFHTYFILKFNLCTKQHL